MPKLSVLYLVRNEEALIGKSMASVAQIADEIVVVDTGSKDGTLAICRQFKNVKVVSYSWVHDFSKPRNFGLRQCTGDWVLYIDADELLDAASASAIRDAVNASKANVAGYSIHVCDHEGQWDPLAPKRAEPFFESPQLRLFRRLQSVSFEGKATESVRKSVVATGSAIDTLPATIHHFLWRGKGEDHAKLKIAYYGKLGARLSSPLAAEQVDGDRAMPVEESIPAKVAIAMCAYNGVNATRQCLKSISTHTKMPHRLFLVDNGSRDGTAQSMREVLGHEPIVNVRNEGVAKGRNMAARMALADPAVKYVCFLDNDTRVTPGWVEEMVELLDQHPMVGLIGPTTDKTTGPQCIKDQYSKVTLDLVRCREPRIFFVEDISRFCMMASVEALRKVGLFDDSLGIYGFEERDLCKRMVAAGFQVAVANRAFVQHIGSYTMHCNHDDWHAVTMTSNARFRQKWRLNMSAEEIGKTPARQTTSIVARQAPAVFTHDKADIVIIAHNRIDVTRQCIDTIVNNTSNYHLIFVDNGCTDGTSDFVKSRVPDATLIKNTGNLGVSKARNQGLRATTSDYVVIMDNDIVVKEGWLSDMFAQVQKGADIVGIEAWLLGDNNAPVKKCFNEADKFSYLGGACCLFKRKVFEDVGIMDEQFTPAYFEDVDICIRAQRAGFKMVFKPSVKIIHKEHQTLIHGGNGIKYSDALGSSHMKFVQKMASPPGGEERLPPIQKRLKILYLGMQWDYGHPERGESFEHDNFFPSLSEWERTKELVHFDFVKIAKDNGVPRMSDMLYASVQQHCPDVLFMVPFNEDNDPRREVVRKIMMTTPTKCIGWFCDSHWRYDAFDRPWADNLHFNVTTSVAAYMKYVVSGLADKTIKSQWGASPKYKASPGCPRDVEVSFVGQPHGDRRQVIDQIRAAGINIHVFGSGWPQRLTFPQMVEMFGRSKINLNLNNACDARFKQIKGRNFEVPACGGFLLTGKAENLHEYYEYDKEIGTFDSTPEMIEKIKYYLAHEEEREAMAAAAHERTMKEHTYSSRFDHIFARAGLI